MHWFDDKRVEEANVRFENLVANLPYTFKLQNQLEGLGAHLEFRKSPPVGNLAGRQELVVVPGPDFKPNGAGLNRLTGEGVISFPD
jgi:hypothetical protein